VHRIAFDLNEKDNMVIALRAAKNYDPFLSRVAALGDNIVGHALFPVITICSGESRIPALALAMVGVMPAYTALLSAGRSVTGS
jgi:predicted N-acetyltransferase YhbS